MYSSKIFVSEEKYKNNLKNREYQKKKYFTVLIFIMFMPCFTTKSRGFTKILPRSVLVHAVRILDLSLDIMLSPPK